MMRNYWFLAGSIALGMLPTVACAKDIVVQMKNSGAGGVMVFEPSYVEANVGDKIHFVPTNPGHNAEPISGMVPTGVTLAPGMMSKEYVLSPTKNGLYGIKCRPHFSMGMVALVKVGKGAAPNRVDALKVTLPPLAQKRMTPMLAAAN